MAIHDGLPAHLAQGMFSKPGKHDLVMRYSSLTPKMASDAAHAPRGLGIKVFDVEDEKLFGSASTQDFTFNHYPILELRDVKGTYKLADSFVRNFNDLTKFGEEQAARPDAEIATRPGKIPPQKQMVAMAQYSQGAYRYDDFVAKFGVFPLGEEQRGLEKELIKDDDPIDVLSTELRKFHKNNKVTYSFCVQLLENVDEQAVEDLGIEWKEDKYPFQPVATIEIEPQDSFDNAFRTWFDDSGVACNP